jgi:hypothetical protein
MEIQPALTAVHNINVIMIPAPMNGSSVRMLRAQVDRNTEAATAAINHQYGDPMGPRKSVIVVINVFMNVMLT